MIRSKEAKKIESEIVSRIMKLHKLGYTIETKYIEGSGLASELNKLNKQRG